MPKTKAKPRSAKQTIRVLIVDDHPLFRDGLAARISKQVDMIVCGEAEDVAEAVNLVRQTKPDVVIVDISLKNSNGIDLIKRLKDKNASVRMLVSSMYEESVYAERAMRAGAVGYVNKQESGRKIVDAIRRVYNGHLFFSEKVAELMMQRAVGDTASDAPMDTLSDRELEVYELIGEGLDIQQIAEKMHVSVKTVETYRDRIRSKLELKTAAALSRHATQWFLQER